MHPLIDRTVGALRPRVYLRHLFFGCLLALPTIWVMQHSPRGLELGPMLFLAISALLYPYARYAYESVIDFFLGDNFFVLPAVLVLIVKGITMTFCFVGAIMVAPVGWMILWYQTRPSA